MLKKICITSLLIISHRKLFFSLGDTQKQTASYILVRLTFLFGYMNDKSFDETSDSSTNANSCNQHLRIIRPAYYLLPIKATTSTRHLYWKNVLLPKTSGFKRLVHKKYWLFLRDSFNKYVTFYFQTHKLK